LKRNGPRTLQNKEEQGRPDESIKYFQLWKKFLELAQSKVTPGHL